jgi:hypothetical protein
MIAALAFASPAIGQSSCGRPNTLCLQVQRATEGAAFSTPNALPNGHLEVISIGRASEWRVLIYSCRDLLRATAVIGTALEARFREGCRVFGVRGDATDAELDAINPFGGERN